MLKKYIFTDEKVVYKDMVLYRIKANRSFGLVKKGTLGGFIENENNLSQKDNSWVWDKAVAFGSDVIENNTQVFDLKEPFKLELTPFIDDSVPLKCIDSSEKCFKVKQTGSKIPLTEKEIKRNHISTVSMYKFGDVFLYKSSKRFINTNVYA